MNYQFPTTTRFSGWHTAVIEREPSRVRYILDGRVVALVTRHLPTSPMYWVLQTEVEQSPNLPSASVAGRVDVAWATAYAWHPEKSAVTHTG
jgi:beta-glucanase (GH16 family)